MYHAPNLSLDGNHRQKYTILQEELFTSAAPAAFFVLCSRRLGHTLLCWFAIQGRVQSGAFSARYTRSISLPPGGVRSYPLRICLRLDLQTVNLSQYYVYS